MQLSLKQSFAQELSKVYGGVTIPVVQPQSTMFNDEYDNAQKESNTVKKRKRQNKKRQQQFESIKVSSEMKHQIAQSCRNDMQLMIKLKNDMLKETDIATLVKKKLQQQQLKQTQLVIKEFKSRMSVRIEHIFMTHQNNLTKRMQQLICDKKQMMTDILETKLQNSTYLTMQMEDIVRRSVEQIFEKQLLEPCQKYQQAMHQQMLQYSEGMFSILGQHMQQNKSDRDVTIQTCIQSLREQMQNVEQFYIKKLSVDINLSYSACIGLMIQLQNRLKSG